MALQKLCIDVIVENFELYFTMYSNTKDKGLELRFEFLKRKFSYEIASSLYEEGKMKKEYIDFLINNHLKVLDFDWLKDCEWDTIVEKFKQVGPDLQSVYFSDDFHGKPLQDLMSYLPNLEVMTFHRYCTNELLKALAEYCDNILEVNICGSLSVNDEGIKQLCFKENGEKSCEKLKKLLFACSSVTEEGVIYILKHIPSIEVIDFLNLPDVLYSIHKKDLSHLSSVKPYNLQKLNLLHCFLMPHFSDIIKICVSVCPHLKTLYCSIEKQEHLKILSELPALEKLHFNGFSGSEVQVNKMLDLNGKKLHSLTVTVASISVFALSNSCPILKYLNLSQANFEIDNVSTPVFPCLETCIIESILHSEKSDKSIKLLLQSSPKLDHIAFKKCILSKDMKADILRCCEEKPIKKINLTGSVVEKKYVQDILLNCHSLKSIILEDCGFLDDEEFGITAMAQLLPNNPEVIFSDDDNSLDDDSYDFFNNYDFEDEYDDYDDYDGYDYYDDYDDYDDDDYGDDGDDDLPWMHF